MRFRGAEVQNLGGSVVRCICVQGSFVMDGIWRAARKGNLAKVQRLVGRDPGLLDARDGLLRMTPLMWASRSCRVRVVRWLLEKGAATNERDNAGRTATYACFKAPPPVVRLLVERGADPTIADSGGSTPLIHASAHGYLEIVRVLLGLPSVKANINHCNDKGKTALWEACEEGHGGVARALVLESGADPTIADYNGTTPWAIAKQEPPHQWISAKGRRKCVAALEVRIHLALSPPLALSVASLHPCLITC
jgi:ankyrin repeat protein